MISRVVAVAFTLAVVIGVTTGCQPVPQPSPSAPVFATEEEAFAAAEATYRSYVDALNQVDLSDPETFEAVYAWTTGDANANERKTLSKMHADGWQVTGRTVVADFRIEQVELNLATTVNATVCSDVGSVKVVDREGQSVVSDQRPEAYSLAVDFVESETTPTGLAIAASNAIEDESCTSAE